MADYAEGSLGWWMERRRAELGLTIDELAARAKVSDETVGKAMRGRPTRTLTRSGLETALQWTTGSINAIYQGGRPTSSVKSASAPALGDPRSERQEQLIRSVATHLEQEGVPRHAIRDFLIRVAAEYTSMSTERDDQDAVS